MKDAVTRYRPVEEDRYKPFANEIVAAAGPRRGGDTFADACRMMALSIWSSVCMDRAPVEKEWQGLRDKYTDEEYSHICKAFGILIEALEKKREEFLGHVLERIFEATNKHNGQFLTPLSVSKMMGDILVGEPRDEIVTFNDPCCGAGVLVIQGAEAHLKKGWRQMNIFVDAGDVDGRACDMCYVQLSLLGFAGVVRHQDAISREYYGTTPIRYTPGYFMHGFPMRCFRQREVPVEIPATPKQPEQPEQMELF